MDFTQISRFPVNNMNKQRRMVLLVEGADSPVRAKTAINLLRYCPEEVVAVLDPPHAGQSTLQVLGIESGCPIIAELSQTEGAGANSVVVGVAPSGGGLPEVMRPAIREALEKGWTVYSGMHQFLAEDPEFGELARRSGSVIVDIRRNTHRKVSSGNQLLNDQLRVLTVGQDCSVGKMVVSLELARALETKHGKDASFLATGQTGILIAGDGIPMDAVVGDFLNGAAESLVLRYQHSRILMIEGQGALFHPRYSPVTLGLMHGSQPQALIYCMEAGRDCYGGMQVALPSIESQIQAYELMARPTQHTPVIGIAVNTRRLKEESEAVEFIESMRARMNLPVTDVIRFGTEPLLKAILQMERQWLEG